MKLNSVITNRAILYIIYPLEGHWFMLFLKRKLSFLGHSRFNVSSCLQCRVWTNLMLHHSHWKLFRFFYFNNSLQWFYILLFFLTLVVSHLRVDQQLFSWIELRFWVFQILTCKGVAEHLFNVCMLLAKWTSDKGADLSEVFWTSPFPLRNIQILKIVWATGLLC